MVLPCLGGSLQGMNGASQAGGCGPCGCRLLKNFCNNLLAFILRHDPESTGERNRLCTEYWNGPDCAEDLNISVRGCMINFNTIMCI